VPWLAGHASVRGISHIKAGTPCQDSGAVWVSEDGRWIIGAVADGGGSLERSEIGAMLAAWYTVAVTSARVEAGDFVEASEATFTSHWLDVVREVRALIELEAKLTPGASSHDFGTTLIAFAFVDDLFSAFQVGDGFLVLGTESSASNATYELIFQARPVEQAGEVVWLTSSLWEEDFRSHFRQQTRADLVCASTDGLEKVAISRREQQPFPGFFKPLAQRVQEVSNSKELDVLARSIASMDALDRIVDDDKTLILGRRIV
jgi:hypothetical protein